MEEWAQILDIIWERRVYLVLINFYMDVTMFLAQIWGPIMLAVGLGIFSSRRHYMHVYKDLDKETFAVFTFAMMAITVGILQINVHNAWGTLPQIVVSILGWGLLAKGALFAIAPHWADKWGNWEADSKLISITGTALFILGLYLSWVGYLG